MSNLKVDFFTHTQDEIAYSFYRESLGQSDFVRFISNIGDAAREGVLLVMQHEDDLRSARSLKAERSEQIIGVVDPRGAHVLKDLDLIDFFVVDSLEKRDFYLGYGRPVFLYHDVLHLPHQERDHKNSDRLILGYHGNRLHLEAMFPVVTTAIEEIAKKREVEFWAIYNVAHLGTWSWKPKFTKIRHLQWDREMMSEYLSKIDIGISPNSMILADPIHARRKLAIAPKFYHEKDEDYLIRFKVPTNPGRVFVFANASIPVISDVCISAMRWIEPGVSGEIAHHTGAWFHAINRLAESPELRNLYSERLWRKMAEPFSPSHQNIAFFSFLEGIRLRGISSAPYRIIEHRELSSSESFILKNSIRMKVFVSKLNAYWKRLKKKLGNS